MAFTQTEQEAVEQEYVSRGSGNSGVMAAKVLLWESVAEDLEAHFQAQINKLMSDSKLIRIDIEEICTVLDMQQGALANKLRGFGVVITRSGRGPNYTYSVSVGWIQTKEARNAFRDKVNIHIAGLDKGQPRMMGGLGLYRVCRWQGKAFPVKSNAEYVRNEEESARHYSLGISKYWKGGNPTGRSK